MSTLKGTVLLLLLIIYNVLVRCFAGLSRPQYVQGFRLFGVDGPLARSAIDVRAYVRSERVGVRDRIFSGRCIRRPTITIYQLRSPLLSVFVAATCKATSRRPCVQTVSSVLNGTRFSDPPCLKIFLASRGRGGVVVG